MWDLIVSVPDHCLSFYSVLEHYYSYEKRYMSIALLLYQPFCFEM